MAIFGIYVELLGNIQVDCGVNLLRIFAMVVAMNVWESLGLMANPSFKRMEMVISNHFPSKDLDHQVKIWIIMVVRVPSMYYIWLQNARPEPIPDTNPKKTWTSLNINEPLFWNQINWAIQVLGQTKTILVPYTQEIVHE